MRLPRTPEFEAERERFSFAFTCESCVYFQPDPDEDKPDEDKRGFCRHEYPTELHRASFYSGDSAGEIVFCKEFELL
jgi:hypothetical protein